MTDSSPQPPSRSPRLRALLFLAVAMAIGAILIVAMTWFVVGSAPRSQAVAVAPDITVAEFVILPDDDAYPAALAMSLDGALYTGSYQTGALWSINRAGEISEITGSRQRIGSVTGLDFAPDGGLYILDRIAPLSAQGGIVWRYRAGQLERLFAIPPLPESGAPLIDDIAVDSASRIYISDRLGQVLRYSAAGEPLGRDGGATWLHLPCREGCEATGLAYDALNDDILVADPANGDIYRVAAADNPAGIQSLLRAPDAQSGHGFDGLTVTPQGQIYAALLGWNRAARLVDGELEMLAKDFRGASDVAYDPESDRLFVSNWNQFSLGFGTRPQLPFALDVIDLSPGSG